MYRNQHVNPNKILAVVLIVFVRETWHESFLLSETESQNSFIDVINPHSVPNTVLSHFLHNILSFLPSCLKVLRELSRVGLLFFEDIFFVWVIILIDNRNIILINRNRVLSSGKTKAVRRSPQLKRVTLWCISHKHISVTAALIVNSSVKISALSRLSQEMGPVCLIYCIHNLSLAWSASLSLFFLSPSLQWSDLRPGAHCANELIKDTQRGVTPPQDKSSNSHTRTRTHTPLPIESLPVPQFPAPIMILSAKIPYSFASHFPTAQSSAKTSRSRLLRQAGAWALSIL